jgi:hypothetical protein
MNADHTDVAGLLLARTFLLLINLVLYGLGITTGPFITQYSQLRQINNAVWKFYAKQPKDWSTFQHRGVVAYKNVIATSTAAVVTTMITWYIRNMQLAGPFSVVWSFMFMNPRLGVLISIAPFIVFGDVTFWLVRLFDHPQSL